MSEKTSPPIWYWIISVVALLWNGMGVSEYLNQAYMTPEKLAKLPEEMQAMYMDVPAWVTAVFAIAVFSGLVASIFLLLRKGLALVLFALSLVAVICQWSYILFIAKLTAMLEGSNMIMTILVPLFAALFVWFAKTSKTKGWIS